jgi:hypothetical protein
MQCKHALRTVTESPHDDTFARQSCVCILQCVALPLIPVHHSTHVRLFSICTIFWCLETIIAQNTRTASTMHEWDLAYSLTMSCGMKQTAHEWLICACTSCVILHEMVSCTIVCRTFRHQNESLGVKGCILWRSSHAV